MGSIFEREEGPRWRRGQKFGVSAYGTVAEAQYQIAVSSSHDRGGREALDHALAAWATLFGVRPRDGVYLSELRSSVQTLTQLVAALETCGATQTEVKAGLARLVGAKLAELLDSIEL
jgi:hypothetical protein